MQTWTKLAFVVLTFSLATLTSWQPEGSQTALSPAEEFGLQLQACNEAAAAGKPDKCRLYGKIQVVEHFGDVKIQVVEHFPDIKVKLVEHFPDGPGKWKMVEHFPDYKIQLVEHFPDYKVKYVEHFPGCD
ncbi:MAG: hypothetical protein VX498_07930 [Myxococcota bacterium]|nr:hypothetical protein [Myxococcota bacterium]